MLKTISTVVKNNKGCRMYNKFIIGMTAIVLSSQFASATDICEFAKLKIQPTAQLSKSDIKNYQIKIDRECELSKIQKSLEEKVNSFNLGLDQITVYQAMRYVQRSFFTRAESENTPVQLIYQKLKTDYSKPNSEKSTEIWDNFQAGIKQLSNAVDTSSFGVPLNLERLKKIHAGFYTISDEIGDFSHVPNPGQLKPAAYNPNHWWKFKSVEEATDAQKIIDELNANYEQLGLLTHYDTKNDPYINFVLSVRPTADGGLAIHSGDERVNPELINNLFTFLNSMLDAGLNNKPMIRNNQLMTPGELAYLAQQFYVGVHPFHEGNGRTSRFLQELILTLFELPHGSSGDLMDIDVLTDHKTYYQKAIEANFKLFSEVEQCLSEYKNLPINRKNVVSYDPALVSYRCRFIK
jgi:hypothetical protein